MSNSSRNILDTKEDREEDDSGLGPPRKYNVRPTQAERVPDQVKTKNKKDREDKLKRELDEGRVKASTMTGQDRKQVISSYTILSYQRIFTKKKEKSHLKARVWSDLQQR